MPENDMSSFSDRLAALVERDNISFGPRRMKIAVITGQLDTEYAAELYNGISEAAKEYGADISMFPGNFASSYYNPLQEKKYDYQISTTFEYAAGGAFDAVIIAVSSILHYINYDISDFLKIFAPTKVIVLEEEYEGYTCLTLNNEKGMKECVEHLITHHGYKKICFVNGKPGTRDAETRYAAYKEVMEAHGLTVTEDMMEYGNFSENCEDVIEKLLLANPDTEAICFANDYMALAAYRLFERIGYHIGRDIAITGFDNTNLSRFLAPPMTTISANAYSLGYRAVTLAVSEVEGKPPRRDISSDSHLVIRNTCGCNDIHDTIYPGGLTTPEADARIAARYVLDNTELVHVTDELVRRFTMLFRRLQVIVDENISLRQVILLVESITKTEHLKISQKENVYVAVQDYFEWLLRANIDNEYTSTIVNTMHQTLSSFTSLVLGERFNLEREMKKNRRVSSLIVNCAILNSSDLNGCYNYMMEVLKSLGIESARLFLYEDTIVVENPKEWKKPDKLYFAAGYIGKRKIPDDSAPIPVNEVFDYGYARNAERHSQVILPLVLNEEHYGLLICDFTLDNFFSAHTASSDIASTLKLIKLNRNLMDRSITDELTGLYNRRGFMEKVQRMINSNRRESGIVIFADLDNLKKINDEFGHEEGDYALVASATILRQSMRYEDVISRHGGDEFVTFTVTADPETTKHRLEERITENMRRFNEESGKPYYVELSVGFSSFRCHDEVNLNEILKNADAVLYERKKKKRQSPRKEQFGE